MKKFLHSFLNVLKWIAIILLSIIFIFLICRFIEQKVNSKTPTGGINENMYVDINGTKQWISIYGQNKDNPVLLYLHGGRVQLQVHMIMLLQGNGQMYIQLLHGTKEIAEKAILLNKMT